MSHIVDFTIDGLAGRTKTFSHKLDRNINVFFGSNGCGKTSLLKILHSAMSNDASILSLVPFKNAKVTIHSLNYKQNFVRTIEKKDLKDIESNLEEDVDINIDERRLLSSFENKFKDLQWKTEPTNKKLKTSTWHHQYLPTSRLILSKNDIQQRVQRRFNDGHMLSEEQIDIIFAESLKRLWIDYTSSLLTNVRNAQESGLVSIFRAVLSPKKISKNKSADLETHQAYLRMMKFLSRQNSAGIISSEKEFKKRYIEDSIFRRVVHDIDKTEQEIEEYSAPRNRLEELVVNLLTEGKKVSFSDRSINVKTKSGINIGLSSLSSGEKQVLRLLVETLLADKSSIMIDEPELSLHIDWQKRLINMMQTVSPKAQLILATHSPEVMGDIPNKNIYKM
jgi:predicted ATPase